MARAKVAKTSSTRKAKSNATVAEIESIRQELIANGRRLDKAANTHIRTMQINDWLIDRIEDLGAKVSA